MTNMKQDSWFPYFKRLMSNNFKLAISSNATHGAHLYIYTLRFTLYPIAQVGRIFSIHLVFINRTQLN